MFFDFRGGSTNWPSNVEYLDSQQADQMLEEATKKAEAYAKTIASDAQSEIRQTVTINLSSMQTDDGDDDDADKFVFQDNSAADSGKSLSSDASFEVLKDGSTALVIKSGCRLKLNLSELLLGGDANREKREREKEKALKSARWPMRRGVDSRIDKMRNMLRSDERVNEYTISMDIRLGDEPPRDGVSLFQTALVHSHESKRTGASFSIDHPRFSDRSKLN